MRVATRRAHDKSFGELMAQAQDILDASIEALIVVRNGHVMLELPADGRELRTLTILKSVDWQTLVNAVEATFAVVIAQQQDPS